MSVHGSRGAGMTDPHRNLFFYYSGQERSDTDRRRQIEDNTTKAVLNALELSAKHDGPAELLGPFLTWVGIRRVDGRPGFALQRARLADAIVDQAKERWLLGMAPSATGDAVDDADPKPQTRPDAWIWGPGFVVCVETKTIGGFSARQLAGHREILGPETKVRTATWREVYRFFSDWLKQRSRGDRPVSTMLVEELLGYLRVLAYQQDIDMGEFDGFQPSHFDAFVLSDDELVEDNRRRVRHYLKQFVEDVCSALPVEMAGYGNIKWGNIRAEDRYAWATLSRSTNPVDEPHFSFSISPTGAKLTLLLEGKAPSRKAMRAIQEQPERFLELATGIDRARESRRGGLSVVVAKRWQKQVRIFESRAVCEVDIAEMGSHDVAYLCQKMSAIAGTKDSAGHSGLFELHIRRSFARDDPQLAHREFVDVAVRTMVAIKPVVDFLECR